PPHGREAGEREGHHVRSGPEVDNPVHALAVGDGRTDLFDQRRTGRLHGDARQDGAGRVSHGSADGAGLRERRRGNEPENRRGGQNNRRCTPSVRHRVIAPAGTAKRKSRSWYPLPKMLSIALFPSWHAYS